MSLAFVRLEEPDAGPANDLTYSVYRLAFAVEQQLHQPPRDTSSQCADENHPVVASVSGKNDHVRQPAQTSQQQKRDSKKPPTKRDTPAVTKSPERQTVQTPQKRLKKVPRKCTFEDPFAFNEDDALLASQDVETPPVFGKVVKRIRAPLADAANTQAKPKKAQLQLQKTNVTNVESDAPPRKVLTKCHVSVPLHDSVRASRHAAWRRKRFGRARRSKTTTRRQAKRRPSTGDASITTTQWYERATNCALVV